MPDFRRTKRCAPRPATSGRDGGTAFASCDARVQLPCSAQSHGDEPACCAVARFGRTDSEERTQALQLESSPHKATQNPICLSSRANRKCGRLQALPKWRPDVIRDARPNPLKRNSGASKGRARGPNRLSSPDGRPNREAARNQLVPRLRARMPETLQSHNYKKVL